MCRDWRSVQNNIGLLGFLLIAVINISPQLPLKCLTHQIRFHLNNESLVRLKCSYRQARFYQSTKPVFRLKGISVGSLLFPQRPGDTCARTDRRRAARPSSLSVSGWLCRLQPFLDAPAAPGPSGWTALTDTRTCSQTAPLTQTLVWTRPLPLPVHRRMRPTLHSGPARTPARRMRAASEAPGYGWEGKSSVPAQRSVRSPCGFLRTLPARTAPFYWFPSTTDTGGNSRRSRYTPSPRRLSSSGGQRRTGRASWRKWRRARWEGGKGETPNSSRCDSIQVFPPEPGSVPGPRPARATLGPRRAPWPRAAGPPLGLPSGRGDR